MAEDHRLLYRGASGVGSGGTAAAPALPIPRRLALQPAAAWDAWEHCLAQAESFQLVNMGLQEARLLKNPNQTKLKLSTENQRYFYLNRPEPVDQ